MDWEENCYQLGCKVARAVANRYLEQKEEQILNTTLSFRVPLKQERTPVE